MEKLRQLHHFKYSVSRGKQAEVSTRYVKDFVSLPKMLYDKATNMEAPGTVKSIITGTHVLSSYFDLEVYIIYDRKNVVGRFALTTYEGDNVAFLGFFECVHDKAVAAYLFSLADAGCRELGRRALQGPVDASFWIKYRLKINRFDVPPYTGEPYNKDYYYDLFLDAGYEVCEHYTSNEFRNVDETYGNEKFEQRFKAFADHGYSIVSPTLQEYDKAVEDVYRMIADLYSDFPIFKYISKDDFLKQFASYKSIMNMTMTKMAYYQGKAVGFYISIPDYGNMVYHLNPINLIQILRLRKKPKKYVMLYMGVDSAHTGLGKALVYSIMKELMKSGLPSIGALVRDGKPNQKYVHEEVRGVYEYVLLQKEIGG